METFSALLAFCARNSPVTGEFPSQRPVTQSFDVFFDLCLNKGLSKQSRRWWFETLSRLLWRHCNEYCSLGVHAKHERSLFHDDVIKWTHFPRYWLFVRGIHWSKVNSPHKDQWCGDLMFSFICGGINGWVNNHKAGDLRRHRGHYDVIVMCLRTLVANWAIRNIR